MGLQYCVRSGPNTLAQVCSIVLWGVCVCYTVVYKLTKVYINSPLPFVCSRTSSSRILKCKCMTLAISMLDNISPCILKRKTIMKTIPTCYAKCLCINKTSLSKCYPFWQILSYWQLADVTINTSNDVVSWEVHLWLRATLHMTQEPISWNCESPKESIQRSSQDTFKNM